MMRLDFTVEGKPVPWARTAAYRGRRLTTEEQRSYQRLVRALAARARPASWPLEARFAVEIVAYGTPRQRFDLDNVGKQILDSCNRILWSDDRHVDVLAIVRRVERERPRVEVSVAVVPAGEIATTEIVISATKIALTSGRRVGTRDPETMKAPRRSNARGLAEPTKEARQR